MLSLELKEFLHNLKDRAWDVNPVYQIDENEAEKIIKQLDRLDSMFVNADEIKHDDEVFNDDYADKNIQNGWIYCKDRLPEKDVYVLIVCIDNDMHVCRYTNIGYDHIWRNDMFDVTTDDVIAWQPLPKWESERIKKYYLEVEE